MRATLSTSTVNQYGQIVCQLNNSTINGLLNTCTLYSTPNVMSMPLAQYDVLIDEQSSAQVSVYGQANAVIDSNFSINPGECIPYSTNWYNATANVGLYFQPRNTPYKEYAMGGNSTNHVLLDIMNLLVAIVNYLGTHTHTGVTTGSAESGVPTQPNPNDSKVTDDITYIENNKNLAITGTYQQYTG